LGAGNGKDGDMPYLKKGEGLGVRGEKRKKTAYTYWLKKWTIIYVCGGCVFVVELVERSVISRQWSIVSDQRRIGLFPCCFLLMTGRP